MAEGRPLTASEQAVLDQKRALVGVASTVLSSSDTATIGQALDRASEMLTHLARGPMGLSDGAERVRQQLLEASSLLRARIRQDAPIIREGRSIPFDAAGD